MDKKFNFEQIDNDATFAQNGREVSIKKFYPPEIKSVNDMIHYFINNINNSYFDNMNKYNKDDALANLSVFIIVHGFNC